MYYFRLLFLILTIASAGQLLSAVHEVHPYEFEVHKDAYMFSTDFQIDSNNTYIGNVKKSKLRVFTSYDLRNEHGWQATGVMNPVSLGLIYPWASEIYIHDTRKKTIACIDGQVVARYAQFSLYQYDEEENYTRIGIAYLDADRDTFTILLPDNSGRVIARLQRVGVSGGRDYWKVKVHHPEIIDDRLIRIFAAFVCDFQDDFKPKALDDVYYDDDL